MKLEDFEHIWVVDFEFGSKPGELPQPRCAVFKEIRGGGLHQIWLEGVKAPPAPLRWGVGDIMVAFYASAEFGCLFELDWPLPVNALDLFTEFRCLHNGLPLPAGNSLLGALVRYGLSHIDASEKEFFRELALRGGIYSPQERKDLVAYCLSDVEAEAALFEAMK